MTKKLLIKTSWVPLLIVFMLIVSGTTAQKINKSRIPFDFEWQFALNDQPGAELPAFDDSQWRLVDAPHDFSIEHPFDSAYTTGAGGGYSYSGIGWYRKRFKTEPGFSGKKVWILFDGVYRNSEVWINGYYLGIRPYGYSSFYYDITKHLNPPGRENVIAVKVNTSEQPNSRWYTGAGIYRHVWLVTKNNLHIDQWGVFARTVEANNDKARVDISIELSNETNVDQPACNEILNVNSYGMGDLLDIVGYNYQEAYYKKDHEKYPNRVIVGSETVIYPYHPGDCWQLRSYKQWLEGQMQDYVAGEFLWTGFDYIGEAGIGDVGTGCEFWKKWPTWPWRGASCGVIDMCGFPKPGYWFRKALWNDAPMVHIAVQTDTSARNRELCSFWSWPKVETHWNHHVKGDTLAVHVYTNVPEVELILNGKSLGTRTWDINREAFLFWEVPYEPGKLEAIGKTKDGKTVSFAVQTAGEPTKIMLSPDRKVLKANRQDLSYVTV